MTQATLNWTQHDEIRRQKSATVRVRELFLSRPGEWIGVPELERIGGRCSWRTRISEARIFLKAHGLGDIENQQERSVAVNGSVLALSRYRFVPTQEGA